MTIPGIEELFKLVSGDFGGIPTIAVMSVPFIAGLVIGLLIKRVLKIAIILIILALAASYFGFLNLGDISSQIITLVQKYGPIAAQYATLVVGILPLGVGFFIGLILGFIFG